MRYVTRRMLHATALLIVISIGSFALVEAAPGDFFSEMRMNPQISAQTINGLRAEYGLDRSFVIRYERWLRSVFKGEFGFSFAYNMPVAPLLWARARNTLLLTGTATLLAWLLALPLGIWGAAKKGKWVDRFVGVAAATLLTIPDLLLFLCLLLLAVRTGWLPAGGMVSPTAGELGYWGRLKDIAYHLALPSLGLAFVALPALIRHVRSAMIEALEAPFLRAAHAHGIPRLRLLIRYALPVAANPLISLFGFSVATLLSASLLVEVIMGWPGLGPLFVEAILSRDIFIVVGTVMLSAMFLVTGNLISDVLLFANDPRTRRE